MAINAELRLDFQIAFKKLMLMIALESVRETYGMLLRDIARFEHKAALKKLKGEKLKTNIVHMGKFISELCAVQEIARGNKVIASEEDTKKGKTTYFGKAWERFTIRNAATVGGGLLMTFLLTACAYYGGIYAGAQAAAWLGFETVKTISGFAMAATTGLTGVTATISNANATSFNELYKQNKDLYDEQKIDQKFKASAGEYDIAYKSKSRNKKDSCPLHQLTKQKSYF